MYVEVTDAVTVLLRVTELVTVDVTVQLRDALCVLESYFLSSI